MGRGSCSCPLNRHPRDSVQTVRDQSVGPLFDPSGYVSICGPSMWRIVFEAAESRWIMGWSDDDAVSQAVLAAPVIAENCVRDYRGRGVAIVRIYHNVDTVPRQHLQS